MRRPLCAVLALLAVLVLASCGGSSESGRELVKKTFGNSEKVKSGKVEVALNLEAQGVQQLTKPITVKFGGPFDRPDKGAPRYDFDLTASAEGQTISAGATSTGDKGVVSVQNTDYALPAAQYKRLNDSYNQVNGIAQPKANKSGDLPWLRNPEVEGDATVGGAETTHVKGTMDIDRLLSDVEKKQQGNAADRLTEEQRQQVVDAIKDPTFEFWTGKDDNILRRIVVKLKVEVPEAARAQLQGLSSVDVRLDNTLSDLNEPQTITAPTRTRPIGELQQRFQGLLQQLGALTGGAGGLGGLGGGGATPPSSGSGSGSSGQLDAFNRCIQASGGDVKKQQKCRSLLP